MDFRTATVASLAADVAARRVSARELAAAALERIDRLDSEVNAFVSVRPELALADAEEIDARIAAGEEVGPLTGIPIAVKDLEDAAGYPTSYGCAPLAGGPDATADSPLVERLRAAGCVVVGKTNTPELGWKADTENPRFGATRNPWDPQRSAGGSSGGTAAALAAGMVPLGTGSDGGGSIRIPSAVCGFTGLKPSLGRVPGGGPNPPGWGDLSTKGPMTLRGRDLALALDCVVGPDPTDLRSLPLPDASWTRSVEDVHPPRVVGWSPTLGYARVDSEVQAICEAAVGALAARGTEVVEIDAVFDQDPVLDWLALAMSGNLRALGHLRGTDAWERLDPAHARMLDWAHATIGVTEHLRALDACHLTNLRLVELFHRVPLLLAPTVAGQTGLVGGQGTIDGVEDANWVGLTYPFNMTRSPAGTVRAGFTSSGMPVGLQVVGPQHADVAVLRALVVLEETLGEGGERLAPLGS